MKKLMALILVFSFATVATAVEPDCEAKFNGEQGKTPASETTKDATASGTKANAEG